MSSLHLQKLYKKLLAGGKVERIESKNQSKRLSAKTVSGMLGHYSAGFTLDTYTHVTTAAQKDAANTMGNILSSAIR